MNENLTLNRLPVGKAALVKKLLLSGGMRRRLQDVGLVEGTRVACLQKSPSGDPKAFLIRGAVIALRAEDAQHVIVELKEDDIWA